MHRKYSWGEEFLCGAHFLCTIVLRVMLNLKSEIVLISNRSLLRVPSLGQYAERLSTCVYTYTHKHKCKTSNKILFCCAPEKLMVHMINSN